MTDPSLAEQIATAPLKVSDHTRETVESLCRQLAHARGKPVLLQMMLCEDCALDVLMILRVGLHAVDQGLFRLQLDLPPSNAAPSAEEGH